MMAYCPLSLHRTGLQNYLSIFIDRVAGQRTKEGYHLPLEKPFFCSRGTPYVGSFLLSWNGERKIRSRVSNKHASLKAIEVQTFPVEGQERGKPPYQGAVSIIQSPGFDKESPGVKHPPRLDFKIVMCSMKSNIMC